jgi:hypothetical protein
MARKRRNYKRRGASTHRYRGKERRKRQKRWHKFKNIGRTRPLTRRLKCNNLMLIRIVKRYQG